MDTIIVQDVEALRDEAFHLFGQIIARSDPSRLDQWASLGLTITQLRVLFVLRGEPGLSAGTLAERLDVTPSTLTRIMDRLNRSQMIERMPDGEDRRCVNHYLTSRGAGLVAELERGFRTRMDAVLNRLDRASLERVVMALRDLSAAMDAVAAEPVGAGS